MQYLDGLDINDYVEKLNNKHVKTPTSINIAKPSIALEKQSKAKSVAKMVNFVDENDNETKPNIQKYLQTLEPILKKKFPKTNLNVVSW